MNTPVKKPAIKLSEVIIKANVEIAPSVFVLTFRRDFEFKAGQVLGLTISPDEDARLYSIASGENETDICILYNIKPGGQLTPPLSELTPGDKLWISVPFGSFVPDHGAAYWISAGTGIAPFMSMFLSGYGENKTLIHGGRTLQSFYFSEKLKTAYGRKYVRCCSTEEGEGVYHGRVTTYLESQENLPRNNKFYLCGSAEMVVDCREILLSKGIPCSNIVAEIYF